MDAKRVLVVDDDVDTLEIAAALLRDEGYCVQVAASGEEALAICQDGGDFDLVLTDLNMAELDGIRLANVISSREKPPTVILMTGSKITCEEAGPNIFAILRKPFLEGDLLRVMQKVVQKPS